MEIYTDYRTGFTDIQSHSINQKYINTHKKIKHGINK